MSETRHPVDYAAWSATCDTLHAHSQVLGKIAAVLAPDEPQLQHAALRLTARGWETAPLPAPNGRGAFVVALDLHAHEVAIERDDGRRAAIPLRPHRSVGDVTGDVLAAVEAIAGGFDFDPTPQEVEWDQGLDVDTEHSTYDADAVAAFHVAASRAALTLAEFRAPFRGRATQVNAWWGSFDLAVNLFSGRPAPPPSEDFIMRNAMDSQEVAVGWWPGDPKYPRAAYYAYAHPAPPDYGEVEVEPAAARWEPDLGLFVLDWADALEEPGSPGIEFLRSAFRHSCVVCEWESELAASIDGVPPPVV